MRFFAAIQRSSARDLCEVAANLVELACISDVAGAVRTVLEHPFRAANAIIIHGMRHESASNEVVRLLAFAIELLEEVHEGCRVISRSILILHAQQVGLAFSIATEFQIRKRQCKS